MRVELKSPAGLGTDVLPGMPRPVLEPGWQGGLPVTERGRKPDSGL